MKLLHRSLWVLILGGLVACSGGGSGSYQSCYNSTYMCTSDGSIVKWHQPIVTFHIDSSVPQEYATAINTAVSNYNDTLQDMQLGVSPGDPAIEYSNGNQDAINNNGDNGIYYITGDWPWEQSIPGSLAVTLTRYVDDGIMQADTFIKAGAVDQTSSNATYWNLYLVSHELGHFVGRIHTQDQSSLMYPSMPYTSNPNFSSGSSDTGENFFPTFDQNAFLLAYPKG